MRYLIVLMILVMLSMTACATVGSQQIEKDEIVSQIKPGITTKQEVKEKLGDPFEVVFSDDGDETWKYILSRAQVRAATFIPVVGIFAGGADTQMHTLTIRFNKDKIVKSMGKGQTKGGAGSVFD